MCLGIPGQLVEVEEGSHLAKAEVVGVHRTINVGLLDDPRPGDWVLIHVGFAMDRIDRAEADRALEGLRMMGAAYEDEIEVLKDSRIE